MANSDGPFLQFANLAKHVSKPPHHTYRYFKLSKFKYGLYFSMWVFTIQKREALVYVDIDQGIYKVKLKVALNEKRKNYVGFLFL